MVNKYELIGVIGSIGFMALALLFLRTDTSILSSAQPEASTQGAVAIVGSGEIAGQQDLVTTIRDSRDTTGAVSKLIIDDILIGSGDPVEDGDSVTVDYIGTLQNGQQFDNSYLKGRPFTFTVGDGKVIEGWEQGLLGMKVGGQRILVIPSNMAYGDKNIGTIPANATLVFAIELLSINE